MDFNAVSDLINKNGVVFADLRFNLTSTGTYLYIGLTLSLSI